MNEVKQAYALSETKKQAALTLYKQAVCALVQKDYVMRCDDAHTELSAIFGQSWLLANTSNSNGWFDGALYAEANIAFNYANLTLGIQNGFIGLAKQLVIAEQRIDDKKIYKYAKHMNSILTATTAEAFGF